MTLKVGLALGSGGTKGFAHIGVLQALEENGVPIDIVAGTSAGAIIGAFYAVGTNLDMLARYFCSVNARDLIDVTVPRTGKGGVIKGELMEEMIRLFTHDKSFEETKIPFLCIAVDAETGETIVFQSGKKLHECVRASMAIPGVFTPVRIDGRLCVDGGVLERVPCAPLREAGADVVIGVDVGYRGEVRRLDRLKVRGVLDNVIDIMQWEITKLRLESADITIVPRPYGMVKTFSTGNAMKCILEGKRAAEDALPAIFKILEEKNIPLRRVKA